MFGLYRNEDGFINTKEKELEELVKEVDSEEPFTVPPIFELYITLFSISLSIMLFMYPEMLLHDVRQPDLYKNMTAVMSQNLWALTFFLSAMLKAIGLMINNKIMRKGGLVLSSALYIVLAVCYTMSFPSIGAVAFTTMAVFTVVSIPLVNHTTIKHNEED